uniref:Uncharacterized protein n=1 Tax=Hanusia phi TaxID=3032 RepID=A0A7S0HP09_9CRYP|mmetsp:Transcript_33941/g.76295  ORF Transcript_33941/g.76295 Transcript_33941/m.76295 type:complete len:132 (+) Transcript_33941:1359-1754(+)
MQHMVNTKIFAKLYIAPSEEESNSSKFPQMLKETKTTIAPSQAISHREVTTVTTFSLSKKYFECRLQRILLDFQNFFTAPKFSLFVFFPEDKQNSVCIGINPVPPQSGSLCTEFLHCLTTKFDHNWSRSTT